MADWPGCPAHIFSQFAFSLPLSLCGKPSSMTFPEEDLTTEAQRHREGKQRSVPQEKCHIGVVSGGRVGKLRLSVQERDRSEVLSQVTKSSIGLMKASELLRVSYRQVLRQRLNLSVLTPFC